MTHQHFCDSSTLFWSEILLGFCNNKKISIDIFNNIIHLITFITDRQTQIRPILIFSTCSSVPLHGDLGIDQILNISVASTGFRHNHGLRLSGPVKFHPLLHTRTHTHIHTHTHTYTHTCIHTHTDTHTHRERERERERDTHTHTHTPQISCQYTFSYVSVKCLQTNILNVI